MFVESIAFLIFIGSAFYLTFYYYFIYLNRIEKKYGINKLSYDSWFSRMQRTQMLMVIALTMPIDFLWNKIFKKAYEKDWYGRQYLEKIPYEILKKYRMPFYLAGLGLTMIYVPDFLDYLGRTYNIYFK